MEELLKKPQTNKGRETLNNLLSAATQLIYERGYYGANIADITRLAGVATGTFYVYFDSKLSLYRFLLRHFSHQIRMELSKKNGGLRQPPGGRARGGSRLAGVCAGEPLRL